MLWSFAVCDILVFDSFILFPGKLVLDASCLKHAPGTFACTLCTCIIGCLMW